MGTSGYHEYHKYHKYHEYKSTTSTTSTGVPGEPRVQTIGRHFRLPGHYVETDLRMLPIEIIRVQTIGRHFRLPGHCVETDLRMLPIEIISSRNPFLLRARESFYIEKFQTEKHFSVYELDGTRSQPGPGSKVNRT